MTTKKNSKRILSVKIIREVDTSPDTSYLGEYSNSPANEFSIDRAHAEDCGENQAGLMFRDEWSYWNGSSKDILNRVRESIENFHTVCSEHIAVTGEDCEACQDEWSDQQAIDAVYELEKVAGECDCSGGDMERHQYRYFNPSFNYVTKDGKPRAMTAEDVRKYTREDYERMERLNRGDWRYLGIRVEAQVQTHGQSTIQRISSGGLWGIESDSERSYFDEVAQDELRELKNELLAIGFSRRAIAKAFETVEGENS